MRDADFEKLCERAWAVGCRNGCFNHVSPWNEQRRTEGDWVYYMPALDERTKAKFRDVIREALRSIADLNSAAPRNPIEQEINPSNGDEQP